MQITYALIIIIGIVTYYTWQRPEVHQRLILNPYQAFQRKQYDRLLTSGFVHNNGIHLFLNLFTLYFFGGAIEKIFFIYFGTIGNIYYVILFLSAIIIANVPTFLKHKSQPSYNSLGASGGVSALVLAFILFDPLRDLCLYAVLCLPGYILGAVFIAYSIIMGKRGQDNINHDAHLFGALYGLLFIIVLRPATLQSFLETLF